MQAIDDPSRLSRDECLCELAAIFAAGIVRLHLRAAIPEGLPEKVSNRGLKGLEVSAEMPLSVHRG